MLLKIATLINSSLMSIKIRFDPDDEGGGGGGGSMPLLSVERDRINKSLLTSDTSTISQSELTDSLQMGCST